MGFSVSCWSRPAMWRRPRFRPLAQRILLVWLVGSRLRRHLKHPLAPRASPPRAYLSQRRLKRCKTARTLEPNRTIARAGHSTTSATLMVQPSLQIARSPTRPTVEATTESQTPHPIIANWRTRQTNGSLMAVRPTQVPARRSIRPYSVGRRPTKKPDLARDPA